MNEEKAVQKRFVVDSMLGKVAKWLRVLGFDARYERLTRQKQLDEYRKEGFWLVTRNRRWYGQPKTLWIEANDPKEQFRELVSQVPISPQEIRFLHRCILCNHLLYEIPREQVYGSVPDYVFENNTSFYQCPNCRRIYWSGSHPKRMRSRLREMLGWSV